MKETFGRGLYTTLGGGFFSFIYRELTGNTDIKYLSFFFVFTLICTQNMFLSLVSPVNL